MVSCWELREALIMANGSGWNWGYLYGNSMFKEESWEANRLNSQETGTLCISLCIANELCSVVSDCGGMVCASWPPPKSSISSSRLLPSYGNVRNKWKREFVDLNLTLKGMWIIVTYKVNFFLYQKIFLRHGTNIVIKENLDHSTCF